MTIFTEINLNNRSVSIKGVNVSHQKKVGNILSKKTVDSIIAIHRHKPGSLLTILEQVQEKNNCNYLPEETLHYISETLRLSKAQVYSVVTFYSFFNLVPQGEHTITICRGTACHTRGSKKILSFISGYLGLDIEEIEEGIPGTTPDYVFTLKSVACFGQCALAPVLKIDDTIYSNVTEEQIKRTVENIKTRK